MRRKLLIRGHRFSIYAVVFAERESYNCPSEAFIEQMSEASRKSMLNVLQQHAMGGPILNEQKSRLLKDGIFEFKSRQGDRLLWFYSSEGRGDTVITHGFHKGARVNIEIERAKRLREIFLQETSQL